MRLIRITAVWCPACLIMRPRFDSLKESFPEISHIEYDYDMDEEAVEQYNVGHILPILILENDGREILRIVGEKTNDEMRHMIEGVL